ncbi:hypothetical protein GJA_2203 [Janthinobacterium agaricidamnosum NBRC 102515 = DSM 9628]|uniref:Uncharacterized protein n=1 Tax=Janthinobacterium agaricidamnosum NBRC 102515 = DSM 9628 TaxID=1349767 RepID=W0V1Y7_9BURK|nr:hypothetical protein GJA_2203 [Janthinobacterium agaricidamnosum NBRC 102515 = DSM 9628]
MVLTRLPLAWAAALLDVRALIDMAVSLVAGGERIFIVGAGRAAGR